ncbi:MAG: Crp/Fnr family transcriptional regulator [Spirochaetaceae bacterium]|jgi:CRP-like cAMP-binding protein|nr:Crp/Fnr family transcriptional regulator [Spirochaetaceae bacterium]
MANGLEAQVVTYNDGQIIFAEYERGDKFYLIQAGGVELLKTFGDVAKTLDIIKASDMFGEMALLEDSPRSATAIARGTTKLMEFNRNNFQNLVLANPQIAFKLLKMFIRRIYDAKRRFMILILNEPNSRIADVFLMLDEQEIPIDKTLTNRREFHVAVENLARWAGLTITQAKESISYYEKLGYLELYSNLIVVKDINNFVRIVNTARSKLAARDK